MRPAQSLLQESPWPVHGGAKQRGGLSICRHVGLFSVDNPRRCGFCRRFSGAGKTLLLLCPARLCRGCRGLRNYDVRTKAHEIVPSVFGGKPCIRGLGFPVSRLLGLLAARETRDSVFQAYRHLEAEDVDEARQYATPGRRGSRGVREMNFLLDVLLSPGNQHMVSARCESKTVKGRFPLV